uniref:disease resistance protein Roq1-like n=1 Tax=Erigeron canadensis TaxID=72917 RepID=UPI001CB8E162|nr:disease resistance protein Roq1-like [Erigeron canadensis]
MASSSSPSIGSWKYDVFLSFRGEDTRKTFVDHLYSALEQHGILTYKDDVTLDRGDTIGPSLMKAIETSKFLVIIFSENYADSSWCLDELSHITKCKDKLTGQIVMPIFYHVDPSDVRKQKRKYGEAFAKHEQSEDNKKKVESWKKALVNASNIAGWEPYQVANGLEAKCIQVIVDSILVKLSSLESAVEDEDLVGMRTRLNDLKRALRIGSDGVRMVGIWGIGGGGKTTLATSIYIELKISGKFHGCCFVENIREELKQQNCLKRLQEKILSAVFGKEFEIESVDIGKHTIKQMLGRRNVLIVLDDVDDLEQLEALAGRHDWFGDGSRIIVTTRNEQVLISHRVDEVYPVSLLSRDEAIRLFKRHAYHAYNPIQDYEDLSLRVISYVNGLPLALKIMGSFLYGKDKDEWLSTLARLKDHPEMGILEKLKISYDGLKDVEKDLFLDIACFHRGTKEVDAMVMLDACGFYPHIGVKVLIQKALISVSKDGVFDMHDLVQEMAHYIVKGQHPNNPEKHSRVWRKEDIQEICLRNASVENDKIEAIQYFADDCTNKFIMLVSNMKKLRFVNVDSFVEGCSFLSNELRYIKWKMYPPSVFPESFQPTKLVVFIMQESSQKELWKGYKYLPCLKELQLVDARKLIRTPDFGGLPSLQKLILFRCDSLEEIHQSLGNHVSLVHVSVSFCEKLRRFPSIVGTGKLEILKISSCKALVEFPKIEAKIDKLVELSLDSNRDCSSIKQLIVSRLPCFLRKLSLCWCKLKDGDIPNEIGELSNLKELNLGWNDFTRLDFSFSKLICLKLLDLGGCWNLLELPELPSSLAILRADWCESLESIIRGDIHTTCKWLCYISLGYCHKNRKGGARLLDTMLQGKVIESQCLSLKLKGLEVAKAKWFEPNLFRRNCQLRLPENWYNHFSGFLICAIFTIQRDRYSPTIFMTHEKNGSSMGDFEHDLYWEEEEEEEYDHDYVYGGRHTWVGYIPFSLLKNTLWWNKTSMAIQIKIDSPGSHINSGYIFRLLPKRSESHQRETDSYSSKYSDDYKCPFKIQHDSKHALRCKFRI